MPHAKFQSHRPSGSGEDVLKTSFFFFLFLFFFAIYSRGGDVGYVTWTFVQTFVSLS